MTLRGATTAGAICPACGAGTPAAARLCPACGQRLGGGVDEPRVVTVFGFPTGHDDAARAVRAALAMRDLSARTLRAARDIVEVRPARPLAVRGQGRPVEGVEVLGLSGAEPAPGPMVGREADLPQEVDVFSRARRQRAQGRLAAAKRVRSEASAMGALALVRRLAEHERDGR